MIRRPLAPLLLSVLLLSACGRAATTPPVGGYRLFLAEGYGNGPQVSVRNSITGDLERELPVGVPSRDWSRYYTVDSAGGRSRLTALDPASGRTLGTLTVPDGYSLPVLGYPGLPAGLSPDGSWITLTKQISAGTRRQTGFLVAPATLTPPVKTIVLNGEFAFDAISDDGSSLYLIETMDDANHYRVRLYDVVSQTLTPQPVADKRESTEPMNGIRGDSVAAAGGTYVLTVYARQSGPFIHALPLTRPYAWCVDLPSKPSSNLDEQAQWSLVASRDGSRVYAVNGSSGLISVVNTATLPDGVRVGRISLQPSASEAMAAPVIEASAKGTPVGGAALSADGRTLFAIGDTGIIVVDTATLRTRAVYLSGVSVVSLRISADGRWLYAASDGGHQLWQLNPQTGAVGTQLSSLSNPWAVLWAEPA